MLRRKHWKTFIVPIEKEVTGNDKIWEEITKNISYTLPLLNVQDLCQANIVNNLSEEIHRIKSKYRHNDKKCETCGIKYKYYGCFLAYTHFKDDNRIQMFKL